MTKQERIDYVAQIVADIKASMERPGSKTLTSAEMKQREDSRHFMATQIKLNGGDVTPEYR